MTAPLTTHLARWETLQAALTQLEACAQIAAQLDAGLPGVGLAAALQFQKRTTTLRAQLRDAANALTVQALAADLAKRQRAQGRVLEKYTQQPRRSYTAAEVQAVLTAAQGNKHKAAAALGLSWTGLQYHVTKFGLDRAEGERT